MRTSFLIAVCIFFCNILFGQNLLLGAKYSFEPAANYGKASLDISRSVLTDGVYTSKYFWLQNTTVGWQNRGRIVIDFNLKNSSSISKVTFNTARNSGAGVEFPNSVYVFGSPDETNFTYLGNVLNSKDNVSGKYQINKFVLNVSSGSKFRYFKFYIIPNGHYAFVDEIEIYKGNNNLESSFEKPIQSKDLDSYVNELMNPSNFAVNKSGNLLSTTFNRGLLFDWVNPWETEVENQYVIKNNRNSTISKSILLNTVDFLAFNLTNNSNSTLKNCSIKIEPFGNSYDIFLVPPVRSLNKSKIVYDALVPISSNVSFKPNETKRFLIKIHPSQLGNLKSVLKIQDQISVPLNVRVLNIPFINPLNTNVWAYLTNPLLIANKKAAVQDLKKHNINTIVIPAEKLGEFDSNNMLEFENYLSNFKGYDPKNIILFCNFLSKSNKVYLDKYPINSNKFKGDFLNWYKLINRSLINLGFNKSKIYLYPYDEINNRKDIENFKTFLNWFKSVNPSSSRIFMTIGNKSLAQSDYSNFIKLVNIIQFADTRSNINLALSDNSNIEKWIYDAKPGAETTSPYSYYRLMSWKAYYYGFTGIGFWSYSDYKAKPFDDVIRSGTFKSSVNYSVIYIDNNNIISSKRWEAFSIGNEDYRLLKFAESKMGQDKVRQLVKKVLDNPNDIGQIDEIKNQLYNLID